MISEYIRYLRDNPEGYWFKAKLYGWGFVPATWQGWIVIVVFVIVLLLNGLYFSSRVTPDGDVSNPDLAIFFGGVAIAVAVLVRICYKTGERPRWQWGPSERHKQK